MTDGGRAEGVVYAGGRVMVESGLPSIPVALWTRGDRIAGIGPAEQLLRAAGDEARVVDLAGAVVLPGLIDAHSHLTQVAYLLAGADCSQPAAPDIPAIQERLARTEPGGDGWVTGSGFAEYKLAERRMPTRWDLDLAVPERPCVVYQVSLHACVVNSKGLAALGYTDGVPDPEGGRLGRDRAGRLDGALYEQPMFDLIGRNQERHAAAQTAGERVAETERAALHFASLGITACTDASVDATGFAGLRAAESAGRLPVRVTAMFWYEAAGWLVDAGMTTGFGTVRLRLGGIKLFADGGMSSRTAAVEAAYTVPAGEKGVLLQPPAELAAMVRRCADAGFQVGIHAQGDRGIRAALDALEPVARDDNPQRHRIEHGGLFTATLRRRAARSAIHVVSQPPFLSVLGDGFLEAFGPERSADLYPFASLRDEGVLVAGSSDAPVVAASPLLGMRDAILRRTEGGADIGPGERLSAAEALAMYTSRAAFVDHRDGELGGLAVGRPADLTILDNDPLEVDPAALPDVRVLRTVVGGATVFETAAGRDPRGPT
jgi:predicted amidohydrolase YtcJ